MTGSVNHQFATKRLETAYETIDAFLRDYSGQTEPYPPLAEVHDLRSHVVPDPRHGENAFKVKWSFKTNKARSEVKALLKSFFKCSVTTPKPKLDGEAAYDLLMKPEDALALSHTATDVRAASENAAKLNSFLSGRKIHTRFKPYPPYSPELLIVHECDANTDNEIKALRDLVASTSGVSVMPNIAFFNEQPIDVLTIPAKSLTRFITAQNGSKSQADVLWIDRAQKTAGDISR